MCLPVVVVVDSGNKGFQLCCVFGLLSKVDHVHCNVVLFQLLGQLDKSLFVLFHGASDKHNDSLALVLVLTVLQRQLFKTRCIKRRCGRGGVRKIVAVKLVFFVAVVVVVGLLGMTDGHTQRLKTSKADQVRVCFCFFFVPEQSER